MGGGDPQSDRYVVDRENAGDVSGVTARASQLRKLVPVPANVPRAALPRTIPTGLYECQLYLANGATMGRLRILNGNSYTGLSSNGDGPASRFAYDAEQDLYRCPQGEPLRLYTHSYTERLSRYRANPESCNACP